MPEKFGIINLQKVWNFGVIISKTVISDIKDSKLTFAEIFSLLPQFLQVQDFIAHKQDIINEAKDLSFDEIKILVGDAETVINNQDVTNFIEDTLNLVISVTAVIASAKILFGKPTLPPAPPTVTLGQ